MASSTNCRGRVSFLAYIQNARRIFAFPGLHSVFLVLGRLGATQFRQPLNFASNCLYTLIAEDSENHPNS